MYDPNLSLAEQEPVDYTDSYNEQYGARTLAVQAVGREMLVFGELSAPREIRVWSKDGTRSRNVRCKHYVDSLTLSREARPDTDDYACVKHGPDTEYLTPGQATAFKRELAKRDGSLFKVCQLF